MIMADVFAWFFIILGIALVLNCHWLAAYALFPSFVESCRERYGRRPVVATVVGLVVLLPLVVIGGGLVKVIPNPGLKAITTGIFLSPILLALAGSAGLALCIGAGLASPVDAAQPWRRVVRGGIVLAFAFLLPFFGWFVLLPWALVSGFGAAVLHVLRGRRPAVSPAPAAASMPAVAMAAAPGQVASA